MNKDTLRELAVEARIELHISDRQIGQDLERCKQEYFHPNEFKGMDPALCVMLKCLECSGCKRVPLQLQECSNCLAVLCRPCEKKIRLQEDEKKMVCPDLDCQECDQPFAVQAFTSKMMLKQLAENRIVHSCKKTSFATEETPQEYSLLKLFDHIHNHCLKKENFCPNCFAELDSIESTQKHLKLDCPKVILECDMCDKTMERGFFKTHPCYTKAKEFRGLLGQKHEKYESLTQTHDQYQKELSEVKSVLRQLHQDYPKKIKELEDKIAEAQAVCRRDSKFVKETKAEYVKKRIVFAQNSAKVPYMSHKYKINANCCFECSYDQLALDTDRCTSQSFALGAEFYFDNTKRMMEFSGTAGYDGKGKMCVECGVECAYICDESKQHTEGQDKDQEQEYVKPRCYYECTGGDKAKGCTGVVCDECQSIRVSSFQQRPQLVISKMSTERDLHAAQEFINSAPAPAQADSQIDSSAARQPVKPDTTPATTTNIAAAQIAQFKLSGVPASPRTLTGLNLRTNLQKGMRSLFGYSNEE